MKTIIFKVTSWRDMSLWRRIECTQAQTLHDLHLGIQSAFKLDDDHLYAFFLNNRPWDHVFDYGGPGVTTTPRCATDAVLAELPLKINKRILYIFDFGDDLRYDVKVVGEGIEDHALSYPRVIDGEGEAPPQYQSLDEDDREHQEEDDEAAKRCSGRTTGPNPRIAMHSHGWASKPVCATRSSRHTSRSSNGKAEPTPPKGSGNPKVGRGARSKKRESEPLACWPPLPSGAQNRRLDEMSPVRAVVARSTRSAADGVNDR